jgi:hypothetical protein
LAACLVGSLPAANAHATFLPKLDTGRDHERRRLSRVFRYTVYGICIESQFPLTSVREAATDAFDRPIRLETRHAADLPGSAQALPVCADDWLRHAVLADGSVWIRNDEIFEMVVSPDGRHVTCAKLGEADDTSFEAALVNFAISISLTLQGEEPLHATVVELSGQAIGLLGASGAGKSTLAAALIAEGADLVTDDMLRLTFAGNEALAHRGPYRLKLYGEPARRLLPAAAEHGYFAKSHGKILVQPRPAVPAAASLRPLRALFSLGSAADQPSAKVAARRLTGMELGKTLIASAMDIRNYAPQRLTRQLQFAEHVARAVPVYALTYPRDYAMLGRVAEDIRRTVGV